MTALGKLLAFSILVSSLGALTWSVSLYVQRLDSVTDPVDERDKASKPLNCKNLKAETDAQYKLADVASEQWGTHVKVLEEREKFRAERVAGYAQRIRWAHKGNPDDP